MLRKTTKEQPVKRAVVQQLRVNEVRGGLTINLPDGGLLMLSVNTNRRSSRDPYHTCTYIKAK
jgi:hypothetical protein